MLTCFLARKMRRNAARSLSSTVARTTVQMSTSRSLQSVYNQTYRTPGRGGGVRETYKNKKKSVVPRTSAIMSTRSIKQQQLKEAASVFLNSICNFISGRWHDLGPSERTAPLRTIPRHQANAMTTHHHHLYFNTSCRYGTINSVISPQLGFLTK